MNRISAVTLDAAGTLIQVREPVGETYARLAREQEIPAEAADISRAFRTVFPRMSPLAFGQSNPDILQRQERDWWRTLVRNCLGAQGQHPNFSVFFDQLYAYYADPGSWFLYDEVVPVLDALETAGIPMAVVSNFDTRLHGILEGLQIHSRFQAVLCSSEVGAAKPHAKIFAAGCKIVDKDSRQVLHAGDDRRADFEGARNAGLRGVWIRRQDGAELGHDIVQDLGALPTMVHDATAGVSS